MNPLIDEHPSISSSSSSSWSSVRPHNRSPQESQSEPPSTKKQKTDPNDSQSSTISSLSTLVLSSSLPSISSCESSNSQYHEKQCEKKLVLISKILKHIPPVQKHIVDIDSVLNNTKYNLDDLDDDSDDDVNDQHPNKEKRKEIMKSMYDEMSSLRSSLRNIICKISDEYDVFKNQDYLKKFDRRLVKDKIKKLPKNFLMGLNKILAMERLLLMEIQEIFLFNLGYFLQIYQPKDDDEEEENVDEIQFDDFDEELLEELFDAIERQNQVDQPEHQPEQQLLNGDHDLQQPEEQQPEQLLINGNHDLQQPEDQQPEQQPEEQLLNGDYLHQQPEEQLLNGDYLQQPNVEF